MAYTSLSETDRVPQLIRELTSKDLTTTTRNRLRDELLGYSENCITGVCARYGLFGQDAQDVTSEVHMKLFKNISKIINPQQILLMVD